LVDPATGALNMKKGEAWLNTFTPLLTYLMHCNTDVTSLLPGTAIKSVFAYVTDYITKSSLKTHTMFEAIQAICECNAQCLNGDASQHETAHKLMVQMVNAMSAKMEMGEPVACMYLLGHEDHYTSHSFKTFFRKHMLTR